MKLNPFLFSGSLTIDDVQGLWISQLFDGVQRAGGAECPS
jgi:hypothetical protein